MERSQERSFCCGAGGARMWMEENLGERINVNRTKEAVATGADQIAVGCPFCRVMLSDGLASEQADGHAREEVEVLDVAQMLLASVKGESATAHPRVRRRPVRRAPRRPGPSRSRATTPRPLRRSPRPPTSARPPRPAPAPRCSTSARTTSPRPPGRVRRARRARRDRETRRRVLVRPRGGRRARAGANPASRPRPPRTATSAAGRSSTSAPTWRTTTEDLLHRRPTYLLRRPIRSRPRRRAPRPTIPESGSLFDLAAPEDNRPSGADVSALATAVSSDEPAEADSEPEPEPEPRRNPRRRRSRRPPRSRRPSPGRTSTSTRAARCSTSEPLLTCDDVTVTPFDVN